jgi:hypothetical protein
MNAPKTQAAQAEEIQPDKFCYFCFMFLPDMRRVGMRSTNGKHVACKNCTGTIKFDRDTWRQIQKGEAKRKAKRA